MATKKKSPAGMLPRMFRISLKSVYAVLLIAAGGVLFNLDRLDQVSLALLKCKQFLPRQIRVFLPGESAPFGTTQEGEVINGRIIEVYDGDTATLLAGDKRFRIRFYGIDAPEAAQRHGIESRDALREKILGRDVAVTSVNTDRYGRTVGRVRLGGRDINYEMVAEGMAWYYAEFAKNEHAFADAQQEARDRRLGLWRDADPEPPWQYRQSEK